MIKGDLKNISEYLKKLKFKKKIIGGIDEADVWQKLELLEKEYEKNYQALIDQGNALIADREDTIEKLEAKIKELQNG